MANAIKKKPNNGWSGYLVYILAILVIFFIILYITKDHGTVQEKRMDEVIPLIENNDESEIKIESITFTQQTGDYNEKYFNLNMKTNDENIEYHALIFGEDFLQDVQKSADSQGIDMMAQPVKSYGAFFTLLSFLFPILLIGILAFVFFKNAGGNNKAFDFARSRAKLNKSKEVTFDDVAGQEEEKEELVEIVDFLKNPKKYNEIGARIPKGVLLSGPPGTGKTLLARACAGEANVPFYSISGSDFVEMFVGVGASRVRDMFKTAKQNAPCIIFIDEIDAVGRQRGAGLGGGHDEREQTLNQLLAEMDGFGANTGVIVMAATNRPDVLDPALLRPGRFDRQIMVTNPDVRGREEILKVHSRNKKFAPTVRLAEVAKRTPAFSGADLENLLNEAALLAARNSRKVIEMQDIDEAMDRVLMGPAKKSRKYSQRDKQIVAFHEAGHAVIGLKLDNAEIVHKVTIIPRGQAGGYNLMLPEEERFVQTKQDLLDQITGLLGGRVAEEVVFNEITTGAHNDFEKATKIARAMVTEFGMSSLGPVQYEQRSGNVFLGRDYMKDRNFSGQIALEIDKEVRRIIDECYDRAEEAIKNNRELLDLIANQLMEMETLTREDIEELVTTGKVKWWDKKKEEDAEEAKEAQQSIEKKEEKENNEPTDDKKNNKVDF